MSETLQPAVVALARARLGVALRGYPTDLYPDAVPPAPASDAGRLAAALAVAAPGLALMLQLRARAYDDAIVRARARGVRHVVSIGNALGGRSSHCGALVEPRWEVDHATILAEIPTPAVVRRVAVADLDADAWPRLRARGAPLAHDRTFFVLHNVAFWSSGPLLECFLPRFAAEGATGSEILLNLLDDEEAGGGALDGVAPVRARAGSAALAYLRRRIDDLGLEVLGAWDTGDLQRHYLGRNDSLVREFLLWIRTPGRPCVSTGGRRDPGRCRRPIPREGRSSLIRLLGRSRVGRRPSPRGCDGARCVVSIEGPDGSTLRVIARRGREAWARGVAVEAGGLLHRIAAMLSRPCVPTVLVDVSSASRLRPHALGPRGEVCIPEAQYSRQLLAHELTHTLVRSRSVWLSEGLAVWMQRRIAPGRCFPDDGAGSRGDGTSALSLAAWLCRPTDLPLVLRPVALRPGRREYRRAAAFVEFVVRSFGRSILLRLVEAAGCGDTLGEVCRCLGYASIDELEGRWRASPRPR